MALMALSGLLYLTAMVFYSGFLFFGKDWIGRAASCVSAAGVLLHVGAFLLRWRDIYILYGASLFRSAPITNLYESLQFFAMLLMVAYLIFEFKSRIRAAGAFATAVAGAAVLFVDAVGASGQMQPLVPALQSNWLLAHVSLSFVAYAFFALSAVSAFLYLILTSAKKTDITYIFWTFLMGGGVSGLLALICNIVIGFRFFYIVFAVFFVLFFWYKGLNIKKILGTFSLDTDKLDILAYKFAVMGFAVFTIGGLVFGAIWAEQAWGRYWSWDPKETWAFITWLLYGIYLHGRIAGRWNKGLSNSIAVFGFILTIFTYLGVNLLLSGLHSYGSL